MYLPGLEAVGREAVLALVVGHHGGRDGRAIFLGVDQHAFHRAFLFGRHGAAERGGLRLCGERQRQHGRDADAYHQCDLQCGFRGFHGHPSQAGNLRRVSGRFRFREGFRYGFHAEHRQDRHTVATVSQNARGGGATSRRRRIAARPTPGSSRRHRGPSPGPRRPRPQSGTAAPPCSWDRTRIVRWRSRIPSRATGSARTRRGA